MEKIIRIVLGGEIQVGKSTLLRRLLAETDLPVSGFMTELDRSRMSEDIFPLYVYPAAQPVKDRVRSGANLLGHRDAEGRPAGNAEIFDTVAADLLKNIPKGHIAVMDELGNLEKDAEVFKEEVFRTFAGENYVLAVVKHRFDSEFLNRIRALPGISYYVVTKENRDLLFEELKEVVRNWQ